MDKNLKKKILIATGAILMYPVWVVSALIKDTISLLLTPFDVERYINCFVGVWKNLDLLHCADYTHLKIEDDGNDKEVEKPVKKTIGFQSFAPISPEVIYEDDE